MGGEEEELIIISSKAKVSWLPQGIVHPKSVIKQYSTWVLLFIMAVPEAFPLAVTAGMISPSGGSDPISEVVQTMALVGLLLKLVCQKKRM